MGKQIKITCAIFDFDGTIFDSMHVWQGIKYKFFDDLGLTITDKEKEIFDKLFIKDAILKAKEYFNLEQSPDELFVLFFESVKKRYLEDTKPKNDIIDFLERLKAKGVKIGIATATSEFALEAVLKKFDMLHYFSAIYSTYTVGASKKESKVYDVVLEELGAEKETTWIFEDAVYASGTVKKSGYNLVGIYDKSEPRQDELKNLADFYIENYSELEIV